MKTIKALVVTLCVASFLVGPAIGAEKTEKKLTCCEQAQANGKECTHKCCVAAHKDGKSCEKCNPNKQDLKKAEKKTEKK